MKTIKNNAGFTLVELLAVIVVLAIIMIVAIPQVMDSLETAKANSFRVEARKLVSAAQAKMSLDELNATGYTTKAFSEGTFRCYTATQVADTGSKYYGTLFYGPVGSDTAKWYARIGDGEYATNNVTTAIPGDASSKSITTYAIAAENIDNKAVASGSGSSAKYYVNKTARTKSQLTTLNACPA